MTSVFDAANFFVDIVNRSEEDQITNLRLNKLLYFAQGCCLSRTGGKLFGDEIEAWDYGPVVPSVYRKYKVCGKSPIRAVDDDYDPGVFSEEEREILLDVMREYGKYMSSELVTITHRKGSPWSRTKERDVIDPGIIKEYFEEHPVPSFGGSLSKIPVADKLPADWYDPEEDGEWEAYR